MNEMSTLNLSMLKRLKNDVLSPALTKREGLTGRISAPGFDRLDRAQQGQYKKHRGSMFSQNGPEQVKPGQ